jgi:hypothetical protein
MTSVNQNRHARSARKFAAGGALLFVVSLVATLGLFATSALAQVTTVAGKAYGVTPRSTELPKNDPSGFANPEGHAVVQSSKVYAIYWDPSGYEYHGDWQHLIDGFFKEVGTETEKSSLANVFAVDSQYVDKTDNRKPYSMTFHGAYIDTDPYPKSAGCTDPAPLEPSDAIACVTDAQMQTELKTFIADHGIQTGMNSIFYVLTPPGVTVCLDGGGPTGHCSDYEPTEESYKNSFCSYHNYINPTSAPEGDESTILYAVIPWIAGGIGDYHLAEADRTSGYQCQDGGWEPSKKGEKLEVKKVKTPTEEKAFAEMDGEEQAKQLEKEKLEGPHQQEPNQIGLGPDGSYDAGLADLITNQIAVEQQNTTTDPLLDGWQDTVEEEVHSVKIKKVLELMDECRNDFEIPIGGSATAQEFTGAGGLYNQTIGSGSYYLNDTFNLAAEKLGYPGVPCLTGVSLLPQFTAPNTVKTNELVGFDGMESDVSLNAGTIYTYYGHPQSYYSTYTWNFGDGSPVVSGQAPGAPTVNSPGVTPCTEGWEAPCAASVYHSYQYGGTYDVTLTITDVGGNTASITEPITVDGPAAPGPEPTPAVTPSTAPSGASPGSGVSSGSGGGSSGGQAGTTSSVPAPVVTASIASTSLKKVKTTGIAVHYSVNEQVAGSVQVLLENSVAKRLGIKGPVASGLAKGSPSEIVIGAAVLVTTKAGKGTVRVKFASKTAERLARSHKLKLTLRLVARNASRTHPLTTTTLSTVVLNG